MHRTVIGIMGPGVGASDVDMDNASELGRLVAREGWILLCGGRAAGVMEAASRGAREAGGLTVGILPGNDRHGASGFIDISIVTGMGSARNNINVLSSDLVIACGMGAGTASEIALALKAGKKVILLNDDDDCHAFFSGLSREAVFIAQTAAHAMALARKLLLFPAP